MALLGPQTVVVARSQLDVVGRQAGGARVCPTRAEAINKSSCPICLRAVRSAQLERGPNEPQANQSFHLELHATRNGSRLSYGPEMCFCCPRLELNWGPVQLDTKDKHKAIETRTPSTGSGERGEGSLLLADA